MTTLVLGASGATGRKLVEQLLGMGQKVRVILRPSSRVPDRWHASDKVSIVSANVSEMSVEEMANHLSGCQSVACCLGHNLTLKGVFGKPRKLVTEAIKLVCAGIRQNSPETPVSLVLMNTAGNPNRDLVESASVGQKIVLTLIRWLVPPQSDNEDAADFLRSTIGKNDPMMGWVVVRPDSLLNEDSVTEYEVYKSPTRSAIFDPGKTSRINVGNFMAKLIVEDAVWNQWKGQMPVIYNRDYK